jgi:hypothetical protein
MEASSGVITPYDRRKFWRDTLFDFGFARAVIDLAETYRFDWGEIVPDLFTGNFKSHNENVLAPLPGMLCEQMLRRLASLALERNKSSRLAGELRTALNADDLGVERSTPQILRALEHGEKFTAAMLEKLASEGLITVSDVTNFQSRGQEFLYIGLTAAGSRMLDELQTDSRPKVPDTSPAKQATSPKRWNVFISHASEDKQEVAHPLAEALRAKGLEVWYDKFTLRLGDSLRESIDDGLANSRFGVVILSKHFFAKRWPVKELNGLAAREVDSREVILPVWHGVTHRDVADHSPMLADRKAVSTSEGMEAVVAEILGVVRPDAPADTVFSVSDELFVGDRVHILKEVSGQPRENWPHDSLVWKICEADSKRNFAKAIPVMPYPSGRTPVIEGPMSGPKSPFKKAFIAS